MKAVTAEETNGVQRRAAELPALDATDRRLLSLLAEDAGRSYTALGAALHLSPPAVHQRVKRLRRDGVIRGVVARLDGRRLGQPLLAFSHVDVAGWAKSPEMLALARRPEVEEIHSVTGDSCLLLKARLTDPQALEELIATLHAIPSVRETRSYVVLASYLERGTAPAM